MKLHSKISSWIPHPIRVCHCACKRVYPGFDSRHLKDASRGQDENKTMSRYVVVSTIDPQICPMYSFASIRTKPLANHWLHFDEHRNIFVWVCHSFSFAVDCILRMVRRGTWLFSSSLCTPCFCMSLCQSMHPFPLVLISMVITLVHIVITMNTKSPFPLFHWVPSPYSKNCVREDHLSTRAASLSTLPIVRGRISMPLFL